MSRFGRQRREYQPDGPLYATRQLKFSGRVVESGALIPPEYISSKRQHLTLWRSRAGNHVQHEKFSKVPVMPGSLAELEAMQIPAPAESPSATAQADTVVDRTHEGEKHTMILDGKPFEVTPGPTLHVQTPQQRDQARKKR